MELKKSTGFSCPECCMTVGHKPGCVAGAKPDLVLPAQEGKSGQIRVTDGISVGWKDLPPSPVDTIRAALNEYYDALTARQHGGVAMDRAFYKIQNALGMSWEQRKAEIGAMSPNKEG